MTALFSDIIFGPIHSRRLGLSLGVNLLPTTSKLCSFDCIYCECGWNAERRGTAGFNDKDQVIEILERKLHDMVAEGEIPDVITFAGNGEPTMHPDFEEIIDRVIELRDRVVPTAKISVLSNATRIGHESVRRALLRVDNNILKLDSAFDATAKIMNNPQGNYAVDNIVEWMKLFEGKLVIQTMFLRGNVDGVAVDNSTEEEVEAWIKKVIDIAPKQVMIYSIDRDTPCQSLEKVGKEELEKIARRVESAGIKCTTA